MTTREQAAQMCGEGESDKQRDAASRKQRAKSNRPAQHERPHRWYDRRTADILAEWDRT